MTTPKASPKASDVRQVDGRRIELSNTAKVLFPKAGLSKGDLIDYYHKTLTPVHVTHA